MNTIEAVVKNGQIVPIGVLEFEEGAKVIVTLADDHNDEFWLLASEESMNEIWDNEEDDIYAELLTK
ncbi:MAG TPA: hypothetical protein PLK77_07755 [Pyrinomonadaceae bacterium]|nr:hypothetical protein [Pyrinomonadaceae bacterium]